MIPHFTDNVYEVICAYQKVATGADTLNWTLFADAFLEEVDLDFSSAWGTPPEHVKMADWLRDKLIPVADKFPKMMHYMTNHKVDIKGDQAVASCYFQILMIAPQIKGSVMSYGTYDFKLVKKDGQWKLTYMKVAGTHVEGNKQGIDELMAAIKKSPEKSDHGVWVTK